MISLELSYEEADNLIRLIDEKLKSGGIEALPFVLGVYGAIVRAQEKQQEREKQKKQRFTNGDNIND